MDLPTHFAFAVAVGLVFFDKPEIALLIGLGALLPDLDREYWFIRKKTYADEQIHRAGLHNVFMMALTYVISPALSLGVFLHVLQDSFTTVKDRGVEWFYPLTRLVKRGTYDGEGNPQPQIQKNISIFIKKILQVWSQKQTQIYVKTSADQSHGDESMVLLRTVSYLTRDFFLVRLPLY